MSNTPAQQRFNQYGPVDGIQSVFSYTFLVKYPSDIFPTLCDLAVYVQPQGDDPNPSAQQIPFLSGQWTIQNVGNQNGGTITFQPGFIPEAGSIITFDGDAQPALNTQFANQENFNGQNLDDALQRIMMVLQQVITFQTNNCIQFAVNTYAPALGVYNVFPALTDLNDVWLGTGVDNLVTKSNINQNPDFEAYSAAVASQLPSTPGTILVGHYDILTSSGLTLKSFLNNLQNQLNGTDGAGSIGYFNPVTSSASTVRAALNSLLAGGAGSTYLTDSGSANTLVCVLPGYTAYTTGDTFVVPPANTITGASTINIQSLGAKNIVTNLGPTIANEMLVGIPYILIYNGTSFVLQNPTPAYYGARVYLNGTQGITANTDTAIVFDSKETNGDLNNIYNVSNGRFTPQRAGTFKLQFAASPSNDGAGNDTFAKVFLNGSLFKVVNEFSLINASTNFIGAPLEIPMNGTTDYVQAYVRSSNAQTLAGGSTINWANFSFVGR